MVSNKLTVLAASAALFESALGFNAHRHLHHDKRAIDKRALVTDWVTEWVTVWVTPGEGDAIPASCTGATTDAATASSFTTTTTQAAAESAANKGSHHHKGAKSKASSTTTSTTVIVVPTTTAEAVYNEGEDYQLKTTLSTSVKSSAAEPEVQSSTTSTTAAQEEVAEAVTSSAATTSKVAATTTSTSAESESTESSSSTDTGISLKRGLVYNDGNLASTFASSCSNCGWGYNWASSRNDLDDSIPFIPTLWSDDEDKVKDWTTNATAAINAGSKVLFSFNEPDIASQAGMSVADAVAAHVKYMNPFKDKALIAAPSVSNSGTDGQGLSYLSEWIEACEAADEPCHYDFCNIHWYSDAQYSDTLFTQIASAKKVCGDKPIWLTEFAPNDVDTATINSFLEEVIPKLEAIDYLEGYSYFMVSTDRLMTSSTSLSTYGETYASAAA